MMRERLGMVCRPPQGFNPLRGGLMLRHTFRPWDLAVRHFTHEQVSERVLRLVAHRRPRRALDEPFPLEDVELLLGSATRPPEANTSEPEDLPEDGSILEESL